MQLTPSRRGAPAPQLRLLDMPPRQAAPPPSGGADLTVASLTVASWNVHKCIGTDGRYDPARTVAVIAELDADLVALQEVDRRFGRRTARLDAAAIERATGLVPLPASDLPDGLGWHGNALLVRPGTRWRLARLDLPGAEPRGAVIAELVPKGSTMGALRVVAAHFGLLRRCRARQAASILRAIAEREPMPSLLLGDLNEWRPPGPRSALRLLEPVFGPSGAGLPSFPSRLPLLALDRILGCREAPVRALAVHESPLARLASDHLPLKARVRVGPGLLAAVNGAPVLAAAA